MGRDLSIRPSVIGRRTLFRQHAFSDLFLKFLLACSMRTQVDLVGQLFNFNEKRLAKILPLMAKFGMPGEPRNIDSENHARNIGRYDRDHSIPRWLFYDSIPRSRVY